MSAIAVDRTGHSWRRLIGGFLISLAGLMGAQLIAAPSAAAGTYRVQECSSPDVGAPDAVYESRSVPGSFNDPYWGETSWAAGVWTESRGCESNGGLVAWHNHGGISGPWDKPRPSSYGDYAGFTFTAPPEADIRRAQLQYYLSSFCSDYSASVQVLNSGGGAISSWGSCNSGGWIPADSGLISGGRKLQSRIACVNNSDYQCAASNYVACNGNTGQCIYNYAGIRFVNLTLEDGQPPQVTALGGQLTEPGIHRGIDNLTISASDNGGGVARANVWVNGSLIATPTEACNVSGDVARALQPCPANVSLNVSNINTEALPFREGINDVQVCAYDYANEGSGANTSAPCQQISVQVDNTCPASGGSAATSLSAGIGQLGEKHGGEVTVPSDEAATIEGTLQGSSGTVAGGTVCIYERLDLPDQERTLVGIAKSHANGTFEFRVPPGPSREFDLAYRYAGQQLEHNQRLRLNSVAQPVLNVTPTKLENGENARFKGAIPGPLAGERVVTLQAKAGKKWRTFKQLDTNEDGGFKGKYKFTRTTGTATYTFRAVVKRQSGYPYLEGRSRKRQVTVRG